jgi:predicted SnoaL-like aldol condensation-catalyzing enzyme
MASDLEEKNKALVLRAFDTLSTSVTMQRRSLRIRDGILVEHWDVIQNEATEDQSKSGAPMFGKTFPKYK